MSSQYIDGQVHSVARFRRMLLMSALGSIIIACGPHRPIDRQIRSWIGRPIKEFILEFGTPWKEEMIAGHKTFTGSFPFQVGRP